MSTLEKAQWSSDSGIRCHFKQYLETIMQSYFCNGKYSRPPWVHLARPVANETNRWFSFHLLSHFLPGGVSCKSVELTLLFCFVSGAGICLCFISPYLFIERANRPACRGLTAEKAGLCCRRARACSVITPRDWPIRRHVVCRDVAGLRPQKRTFLCELDEPHKRQQ